MHMISVGMVVLTSLLSNPDARNKPRSNGNQFFWDGHQGTVRNIKTKEKRTLFIAHEGDGCEGFVQSEDASCSSTNAVLLSVVGATVSWQTEWYAEGGAHPSYGTIVETTNLDASEPGPANLATLFGDGPVLATLSTNKTLLESIETIETGDEDPLPDIATLNTLGAFIDRAYGGCTTAMGFDLLTDFYFLYRSGKRMVAVEIGLTHGCEMSRGAFTKIGPLLLPIPDSLRNDIDDAVARKQIKQRAGTPSYNCKTAKTRIERAVCKNSVLADRDSELAALYKAARAIAPSAETKEAIKVAQSTWLAQRDSTCASADVACLTQSYELRRSQLLRSQATNAQTQPRE